MIQQREGLLLGPCRSVPRKDDDELLQLNHATAVLG